MVLCGVERTQKAERHHREFPEQNDIWKAFGKVIIAYVERRARMENFCLAQGSKDYFLNGLQANDSFERDELEGRIMALEMSLPCALLESDDRDNLRTVGPSLEPMLGIGFADKDVPAKPVEKLCTAVTTSWPIVRALDNGHLYLNQSACSRRCCLWCPWCRLLTACRRVLRPPPQSQHESSRSGIRRSKSAVETSSESNQVGKI